MRIKFQSIRHFLKHSHSTSYLPPYHHKLSFTDNGYIRNCAPGSYFHIDEYTYEPNLDYDNKVVFIKQIPYLFTFELKNDIIVREHDTPTYFFKFTKL